MRFLFVAVGGACGSVARFAMSILVARFWKGEFPLATVLINVSGCFILGFFVTYATERLPVDPLFRLLIATGFVGAYTTFSTFEYETQSLVEAGRFSLGVVNVLTSVLAGYAAVQAGVMLARR